MARRWRTMKSPKIVENIIDNASTIFSSLNIVIAGLMDHLISRSLFQLTESETHIDQMRDQPGIKIPPQALYQPDK